MTDSAEFTVVNADGIPLRFGECLEQDLTLQASGPGEILVPSLPTADGWWTGVAWEARPVLGVPATVALAVNEEWAAPAPAGSTVFVDRVEVGILDDALAFDTAGEYQVRFVPPSPYLPAECLVAVT